jgi:Lrp/AsnC family leucine-responsive transcriptional regulator
MDKTDLRIVRLLQLDGRMSHEQISKEINLSRPAVHDRIRRLEAAGVIRGYSAQVDWDALGLSLGALIFARINGDCVPAAHEIFKLGGPDAIVQECHRVAGDWCMVVQTRSASTRAFQRLLDDIRALPEVRHTMTTITLSTILPEQGNACIPAIDSSELISTRI